MTNLAFVDTETIGLDPDRHAIWEVALILREPELPEIERVWQLPVDVGLADPYALNIGGWYERRKMAADLTSLTAFAATFSDLTWGAHIVGAVPSFDEERLRRLLRANGACPGWHYHLVDVEALAAGYIAACRQAIKTVPPEAFWAGTRMMRAAEGPDHAPPWNSAELSLAVGVEPELYEKHTALGDARWARDIYDAVMVGR